MLAIDRPELLVVTGPSAAGKSSLVKMLVEQHPNEYYEVIGTVSRQPRINEIDGVDYYFRDRSFVQDIIDTGNAINYTEYCGNLYALDWRNTKRGLINVVIIEPFGALSLQQRGYNTVAVLVKNPEYTLKRRARDRGDTEQQIAERQELRKREYEACMQFKHVFYNV